MKCQSTKPASPIPGVDDSGKDYVLGTDDAELARLGLQHDLWRDAACSLWSRAGISAGTTVLDLGCGPGFTTRDLAQAVSHEGHVIAVDASERFIRHVQAQKLPQVEARTADARNLDLPPSSIDAAYARWVLMFVADADAVIRHVAHALRPGGVFALQEYADYALFRLIPDTGIFRRVVEATGESIRRGGGDPLIGMKLPAILSKHGLDPVEITPILRWAHPCDPLWQWPGTFFTRYVAKLVESGLLTTEEKEQFDREWRQRSEDLTSVFCASPVLEIIARKTS